MTVIDDEPLCPSLVAVIVADPAAPAVTRPLPSTAATVALLLVQAIALGELGSVAEAREVVRASFPPTEYEPEDGAAWDEAYARFRTLAGAQERAA